MIISFQLIECGCNIIIQFNLDFAMRTDYCSSKLFECETYLRFALWARQLP